MKRITARSRVYWDGANGKELTGIVEQVMMDHVFVATQDGKYLVRKAALKTQAGAK